MCVIRQSESNPPRPRIKYGAGSSGHPSSCIRNALKLLVEQGKIGRSGAGKKNDPFRYFSCCRDPQIRVPENVDFEETTEKDRNNNLSHDSSALGPEKWVFPRSHIYTGNKKKGN